MKMETGVTELLSQWRGGDASALEGVLAILYEELRRVAASYLGRERDDHTLQPTALVHEAVIRLMAQQNIEWKNRNQFIGIAAQMMRRILVDHARGRQAIKRGGEDLIVDLDPAEIGAEKDSDLVALDDALRALEELDARQARIVELRFFAGLTIEETATTLELSPATVKREWALAKAWLYRELHRGR